MTAERLVPEFRIFAGTINGGGLLEVHVTKLSDETTLARVVQIVDEAKTQQFTATAFIGRLQKCGVAISMDGRGRALDNVFVERLWRSVKYEEVYLKDYLDDWEARRSLARYFEFYCQRRIHKALNYRTPADEYRRATTD